MNIVLLGEVDMPSEPGMYFSFIRQATSSTPGIPPRSSISSAVFDIRSGKVDKNGRGRHLYIDRRGPSKSRMLDLLLDWTSVAHFTSADQAFLSHASRFAGKRKHLTRKMVSGALKRMASHFGFDEAFLSTHSLRTGGMSCGTAASMANVLLCRIAGWSGNSEALYRRDVPDHGNLSALDAHQLDTRATLLSVSDVRKMLPTAMHSSFSV